MKITNKRIAIKPINVLVLAAGLLILVGTGNALADHSDQNELRHQSVLSTGANVSDEPEDQQQRIEINNGEFKIRGILSSLNDNDNSFVVAGRTITVDPSRVDRFRLRGDPAVGDFVEVRGIVDGQTLLATRIRLRDEEEDMVTPTPTPQVNITPTPTPNIEDEDEIESEVENENEVEDNEPRVEIENHRDNNGIDDVNDDHRSDNSGHGSNSGRGHSN